MWFTIASLLCQGTSVEPSAISTRMIAVFWWLFALILVSSYTANLAAFLTVEGMATPIEDADDLAKQTRIKYGLLESSATEDFFRTSRVETYARMWSFMKSTTPKGFVETNAKGIERTQKGSYAYLTESTKIEYIIRRDCDMVQIGGHLDSKGYAIGFPKGSRYRSAVSSAILDLKDKGILADLKTKWWEKERGGSQCPMDDGDGSGGAIPLGLSHISGVFTFVAVGMALAIIVAITEFCYRANQEEGTESKRSLFLDQMSMAFQCASCKAAFCKRSFKREDSDYI